MKKTAATLVCVSALMSQLHGIEVLPEFRGGYLWPTGSTFSDIYKNGGGYVGYEVSCQTYKGLYTWTNGSYFNKNGKSVGASGTSSTQLYLVPLAGGFKWFWHVRSWDFYVGMGAVGTYIHTRDNSPYLIPKSHKWTYGGMTKMGVMTKLYDRLYLDFFADYTFSHRTKFPGTRDGTITRSPININNWMLGIGVGYRFGDWKSKKKASTPPASSGKVTEASIQFSPPNEAISPQSPAVQAPLISPAPAPHSSEHGASSPPAPQGY
jgi:hypothetical protein